MGVKIGMNAPHVPPHPSKVFFGLVNSASWKGQAVNGQNNFSFLQILALVDISI